MGVCGGKNIKAMARPRGRRSQGFSLLETTVALGIASVLLLALAQYALFNSRAKKSQDLTSEFNNISALVGTALSNQIICTATLKSQVIPAHGKPASTMSVLPGAVPNAPPILAEGFLPSGLTVGPIALTNAGTMNGNPNEHMLGITITATKTPPINAGTNATKAINSVFVGGNTVYTKTFNIAVWTDAGGTIQQCTSSKDMGQSAPVPIPTYSQPVQLGCSSSAPDCQGGSPVCCHGTSIAVPYWACQTNGWSSCS
jgi:type II secretory pathway pseudopilin PulG